MASVEFTNLRELRAFFEKYLVFVSDEKALWSNVLAIVPFETQVNYGAGVACQCITAYMVSQPGNTKCHVLVKVCNSTTAHGVDVDILKDGDGIWYRLRDVEQWFAAHFNRLDVRDVFGPLLEEEADEDVSGPLPEDEAGEDEERD
jgi:hypothetical protein